MYHCNQKCLTTTLSDTADTVKATDTDTPTASMEETMDIITMDTEETLAMEDTLEDMVVTVVVMVVVMEVMEVVVKICLPGPQINSPIKTPFSIIYF